MEKGVIQTGNVTMAGRRSWNGKNVIYEKNVIYACGHPSWAVPGFVDSILS
jgi:hypothetical protein